MTVANMEVYDALIDVGVSADKARRAAEAVGAPSGQAAAIEGRLSRMEADIAVLKTDVATLKTEMNGVKVEVATLRGEIANLKWIVVFHGALTLVVLGKLFALI